MTRIEAFPLRPLRNGAGLVALALLLTACAGGRSTPAPIEERDVDAEVRAPAKAESAGVQVYPLKNPAVAELTSQADRAEQSGNYDQAAILLERALRIQPRDPELLQHMAEVQVQKQDYAQALSFATRSFDIGPRVGEICARNWRTIGLAREQLGDNAGAREASGRADQCMVTKPQGL
ncbi:tetratricopeptide repeat protein [Marinihelvus fidelis]|uniref:tetratricopeptide repeat protein n=1 Tax=Marinihelvus fidelis TaxID=2613842 RepID=UPI00177BE33D|nr:tetratricopeptide repeat protein [Marinihelvus fidelis]